MFKKFLDLFKNTTNNKFPSKNIKLKFDRHGLGDVCQFIYLVQLYHSRGYTVTVQIEENKRFLWKIAGVNIVSGGNLPDHECLHPYEFNDLNFPDYVGNKVLFGLSHPFVPNLSELGLTKETAWDELCKVKLSAHSFISDGDRVEVDKFLEGLPKPIICFHSCGNTWQERKSIPIETAFKVILKLLDSMSGSVIVLDNERRAPMVGDERCKGIKPSFKNITLEQLCALYEKSELMIGIDSGPFHVANLTPVKCLGIFRDLQPTHVCLPNPNAIYLASSQYEEHWKIRRDRWNIATYEGEEPTADEIVDAAMEILQINIKAKLEEKNCGCISISSQKNNDLTIASSSSDKTIYDLAVQSASSNKESNFVYLNPEPICKDLIDLLENYKKPIKLFLVTERPLVVKNKFVKVLRMNLKEAANKFSENSVDFLFINHYAYGSVTDSILAWKNKIAPNGLIAGNNFDIEQIYVALADRFALSDVVKISRNWFWKNIVSLKGKWIQPIADQSKILPSHVLFIPYCGQKENFENAAKSINCKDLHAFVIDNSIDGIDSSVVPENWGIFKPKQTLSFSEVQNIAQKIAIDMGVKYLLCCQSDSMCLDNNLVNDLLQEMEKYDTLGLVFTLYDAIYSTRVQAIKEIGVWDESFKYNSADIDYYHRFEISKWDIETKFTSRVVRQEKKSIASENTDDQQYLIDKWGKDKTFNSPFNF